jgi:catechol 2,3-dioxygenase-like lactoylglutathione lyase family enzyme
MHTMFYSSKADELRAFLRDKLGLSGHDVGEGWLIFDLAEADLGVHPTDGKPPSGTADISFYCDDLEKEVAALKEKGVEFVGDVADRGWGLVTHMKAPGDFQIMLYQPKYGR